MKVQTDVNPLAFADRRNAEQRRHGDNVEEARWRARIWLKQTRRAAEPGRTVSMVSRLGPMGPDRQGGVELTSNVRPFPQRNPESCSHPENPTWKLLFVRPVRNGWTTLRRLLQSQETAK